MHQPGFERFRMVGRDASADATFGAKDHRDLGFAPEHIAVIGADVDKLVHGDGDEIDVHDLGDRPHASKGCSDRRTGDGRLRDGRIDDPLFAELGQEPARGLIGAAVQSDVLAEDEDPLIAPHLFRLSGGDRLGHIQDVHAILGFDLGPCLFDRFLLGLGSGGGYELLESRRNLSDLRGRLLLILDQPGRIGLRARTRPWRHPRDSAMGCLWRTASPSRSSRSPCP